MDLGPGMQRRGQEHAALREELDIYCNLIQHLVKRVFPQIRFRVGLDP